jgi:cell division protein FtsN
MSGDKSKVVAAVFIGMVLGITAAGAVAWFVLQKNPTAFTNKEPKEQPKPAPQIAPAPVAVIPPVAPASGVDETKQHFEFYRVLTDKEKSDNAAHKSKPAPKPKEPVAVKPQPAPQTAAVPKEIYYLQAGSFQNEGDAEKLKAKLAFSGFEANIQTVDIPDKGVWHRVRLGPYNSSEASKTIAALKLNGIIATQQHAQ